MNNERQAETKVQQSTTADLLPSAPLAAIPLLADVRSNKKNLKVRIFEWIKENDNESIRLQDIKQTNISFRKSHHQDVYYFTTGGVISPYTMKRWVEIAENKLFDTWKHNHGTWYWIKDNAVIM